MITLGPSTRGLRVWLAAIASAVALVHPTDATAQLSPRSGLWFELGLGPSSTRIACTGCAGVTHGSGPIAYAQVGGALADGVLFGVEAAIQIDETFGRERDAGSVIASNQSLHLILLWFPWRAGFFVKGGVGVAAAEVTLESAAGTSLVSAGVGVGMSAGIGWDFAITRHLAITANAGSWVSAIGDLVLPEVTVDDVIATRYGIMIGLTIR